MNYYGESYIGRRSSNQDRFLCISDNGYTLLAVADGMGGHTGGEIASQMAVDILEQALSRLPIASFQLDLKKTLEVIFKNIDESISQYVEYYPNLRGMGTTLSCALLTGSRYVVGNIGDSRVYLYSNDHVKQLTVDDTLIQDYINQFGHNVPEDLSRSGHVLTKALNGDGDIPSLYPIDQAYYTLADTDFLVLMSDGLISDKSNESNIPHLHRMLNSYDTMHDLCQQLISSAYIQGSQDNCTVVVGGFGSLTKRADINSTIIQYPPHQLLGTNQPILKEVDIQSPKWAINKKSILVLSALVIIVLLYVNLESKSPLIPALRSLIGVSAANIIEWPVGFVHIGDTLETSSGSDVEWFDPSGTGEVIYFISVYQNNILVKKDSLSDNKYSLTKLDSSSNKHYQIKIEANVNGKIIKPVSNGDLRLIIKQSNVK